jgi:hypothetical protein
VGNSGFKLGWDQNANRVVHIDEVSEGFKFAVCPDCGSSLVAANRNSNIRVKATYFRHHTDTNCDGESLIHLWAKQVIFEKLSIKGAEYYALSTAKDLMRKVHLVKLHKKAETLAFQSCELEKTITKGSKIRVPDISALLSGGENLYVEIFVHNEVDELRSGFYQDNSLNCLEIDLSDLPPTYINYPELFENYVIDQSPRKWVYCSLYSDLDRLAKSKAKSKAKIASDEANKRRSEKRSAQIQWREEHMYFISLINAYLDPANQKMVTQKYQDHLIRENSTSFNTYSYLRSHFHKIPEVVNIQVKGELGFNCHRSVWQWEIYKSLVIDGYYTAIRASKSIKTTWATRGYEKGMALLAWYDYAPKLSAERLYIELLNHGIAINRICSGAEEIVGEPIFVEGDRPEKLQYLKIEEWRELPKPVCVIRRYLRELVNRGIIETMDNNYLVKQGAKPPLCK